MAQSSYLSAEICVGDMFETLAELEARLEEYKQLAYIEHWKRHYRIIPVARKCGVNRHLNDNLKYYDVVFMPARRSSHNEN